MDRSSLDNAADNQAAHREDFATLWAKSFDRIRAYIRLFVPSVHDADDVLQETAVAIARDFDKYDRKLPFLDWAIGVARNRVLQHYRRSSRDRRMLFDAEAFDQLEARFVKTEPMIEMYREALATCIEGLPPTSRRLLDARYVSCLKTQQIADRLEMTTRAVFKRLAKIRESLRACIQRRLRVLGELP